MQAVSGITYVHSHTYTHFILSFSPFKFFSCWLIFFNVAKTKGIIIGETKWVSKRWAGSNSKKDNISKDSISTPRVKFSYMQVIQMTWEMRVISLPQNQVNGDPNGETLIQKWLAIVPIQKWQLPMFLRNSFPLARKFVAKQKIFFPLKYIYSSILYRTIQK